MATFRRQVWARNVSANQAWQPGAQPGDFTSGVDMQGTGADPLFLTAFASDAGLIINPGPAGFLGTPPAGFIAASVAIGTLNAATAYGTASRVSAYELFCGTTFGGMQFGLGLTTGAYYLEATLTHASLFSNAFGVGMGRAGLDYNQFTFNGRYSPLDANGGGMIKGGVFNSYAASMGGDGVAASITSWNMGTSPTFGFAFLIAPNQPIAAIYNPRAGIIALPAGPCCPTYIGKWDIPIA